MAADLFKAYDLLPVGILVARSARIIYANDSACGLMALTRDRLVNASTHEIARHVASPEQWSWLLPTVDAAYRGDAVPEEIRVRLTPAGAAERTVRAFLMPGFGQGEILVVLLDSEEEAATRALAEAMAVASGEFVRCRDEREVLEVAADAIHALGYFISMFELEGDYLVGSVLRQDERLLRLAEKFYGMRAEEVRFHRSRLPHLEHMFETRRACYSESLAALVDIFYAPDVAKFFRDNMPPLRTVEAPIFLGGRPWGLVSVHGATLTPSAAPTLEMFAQLISAALENVAHHRQATERLRELTALQAELVSRERLAAIGEAAGVLSHEARNPLGAILNALAVLRRSPSLDDDGRAVLDIAEEEALKLDALVRDLMELARPLEPRLRPVKVEACVEAAWSDVRRRLGRSAPQVSFRSTSELPEVHADPALLKLALENLLRNAAQSGGGVPVHITAVPEGDFVVIGVGDVGEANPGPAAEATFDPFATVRARGTGLGLAVVKRVVEAQGGVVRGKRGGARLEIVLGVARTGSSE